MIGEEDRLALEAIERLLPPEPAGFFEAFWGRAAAEERRRAGQRRAFAVAVAVATAVVVAAAGVYAAPAVFSQAASVTTLDRTYTCSVLPHGMQTWVDVSASVRTPYEDAQHNPSGKAGPVPAELILATAERTGPDGREVPPFGGFHVEDVNGSLFVDRFACGPSARRVPLSHARLTPQGSVTLQFLGGFSDRCITARRVVFHLRLTRRDGTPTAAKVAVRNDDAKSRPIAYVDWTPKRITYFLATSCVSNK